MAKVKITVEWLKNTLAIADNSRGHSIVMDEPPDHGGEDKGPTPFEVPFMGLAGCIIILYAVIAKRSGIKLTRLMGVVEAEKPAGSPEVTKVILRLKVSGKASKKLLETVWRKVKAECPVHHIFHKSIPIKSALEIISE